MKRLWEAYENLNQLLNLNNQSTIDEELDLKVNKLLSEFDEFMDDDFNTAKVLANMFELAPIINGIKNKQVVNVLSSATLSLLQRKMKIFLEDIFGLKGENNKNEQLDGVLNLLISMRKQAKIKKDFLTSDTIRKELLKLGVQLKDEKDGNVSYSIA